MDATRFLVVIADDYGIGPETSRGILELAQRGLITATVLLSNSPHAEAAVRDWRRTGAPMGLGWHPCLTMDPPAAPASQVPSLIGPNGCLWPLGRFLTQLYLHQICPRQIEIELIAQYNRFLELVGSPPAIVNSHQHVGLFPPVGAILRRILTERCPERPYFRRVQEPWSMLARIPGARKKRTLLNTLGRAESWRQRQAGFPGNDWLAGITDPFWVKDPAFFTRWLARIPGRIVELACHPGHLDPTLVGRDCEPHDGLAQRRVDELHLLLQPSFPEACRRAGFRRIPLTDLLNRPMRGLAHAA
jgi:predicted glycoside hydrolase/deacetylase ChbG (UPF0249 family)